MVTDPLAAVWANDLSDIALADATEAVREHFRTSTEYLLPVHVVRGVKAARVASTMSPELPDSCNGKHMWLWDGTCVNCLARDPNGMNVTWHAPGISNGATVAKPSCFEEMAAAAEAATQACLSRGYSRGDEVTKNSAWEAAHAVWEAEQ